MENVEEQPEEGATSTERFDDAAKNEASEFADEGDKTRTEGVTCAGVEEGAGPSTPEENIEQKTEAEEQEDLTEGDGAIDEEQDSGTAFEDQEAHDVERLEGENFNYSGSIKSVDEEILERPLELEDSTAEWEKHPLEDEKQNMESDRKEQLQLLQDLQAEREKLIQRNDKLQNNIVTYLSKKRSKEPRPGRELPESDLEERYRTTLTLIEGLKQQHQHQLHLHQRQMEELEPLGREKVERLERERKAFMAKIRQVALEVLTPSLGKTAALDRVEQLQEAEEKHEDQLVDLRLKNIRLKMKVQELEAVMRERDETPEDRHLIEQLKIENETYKEKMEELSEEHLKVKKKINKNVEVVSHVKETLHFLQEENQLKRSRLDELDAQLLGKREELRLTKQQRDRVRADKLRLQQRCGLLGNHRLLKDFEEKVDESESLNKRLDELKRRHAELTLRCAEVKKKMERSATLSH